MFILQESPINIHALRAQHEPKQVGAYVCFEGIVRRDSFNDTTVNSLLYIADQTQCISEGELIIKETNQHFPLTQAICVQRFGQVHAGDMAIWIGVWSLHRDEAFKGCRFIIEETKKRLHIWKKEFHADGTSKWIHGHVR